MSNTIKYELVCPESKVESGEADSVLVPGYEGDLIKNSNKKTITEKKKKKKKKKKNPR